MMLRATLAALTFALVGASDAIAAPDLMEDAVFLKGNPNFIPAVTELITRSGYECPRIAILWNRGTSPYGLRLEALCGPRNSRQVYPVLHYAVYVDRLLVKVCAEFGAFSRECE